MGVIFEKCANCDCNIRVGDHGVLFDDVPQGRILWCSRACKDNWYDLLGDE